jgi:hypothetical protein
VTMADQISDKRDQHQQARDRSQARIATEPHLSPS